jgi:hypothetical protein
MENSIRIETHGGEPNSERFFKLAKIFAELGAKDACIEYLRKAFLNGFNDRSRLHSEPAFRELQPDEEFGRLVQLYGMQG